jgi:hypothetical protein
MEVLKGLQFIAAAANLVRSHAFIHGVEPRVAMQPDTAHEALW